MVRVCEICGHDFEDKSKFKPTQYCSIPCSNYSKYYGALQSAILLLRPTKKAKKLIKGDMFRLSNSLSNSTNTILDVEEVF